MTSMSSNYEAEHYVPSGDGPRVIRSKPISAKNDTDALQQANFWSASCGSITEPTHFRLRRDDGAILIDRPLAEFY